MLRRIVRTIPAVGLGALNAWVWMIFLLPTSGPRFSYEHLSDAGLLAGYFLLCAWVLVIIPCSLLIPEASPLYRPRWAILAGAVLSVPAFLLCGALFHLFDPFTEYRFVLWVLPAAISTGIVIGALLSWLVARSRFVTVVIEQEIDDEPTPAA